MTAGERKKNDDELKFRKSDLDNAAEGMLASRSVPFIFKFEHKELQTSLETDGAGDEPLPSSTPLIQAAKPPVLADFSALAAERDPK
ncbi:hypothetical protein MRX96_020310 [Rhipicephalus microplus]